MCVQKSSLLRQVCSNNIQSWLLQPWKVATREYNILCTTHYTYYTLQAMYKGLVPSIGDMAALS